MLLGTSYWNIKIDAFANNYLSTLYKIIRLKCDKFDFSEVLPWQESIVVLVLLPLPKF